MKQLVLILMLCFGITSFAYAQEDTSTEVEVMEKEQRVKPNVKKIKDVKQKALADRKQALEERAEFKDDLKMKADEARIDLRAQFKAATTTEAKAAVKEEAQMKREELKETAQEYKEQWRQKVQTYFQARIEMTFKRFSAHVEKAEQVDARIVNVLGRLEAAGLDTTAIKTSLEQARENTASAKEAMRTVRADLESAVETGSKEEVRAAFNQAKADIKEATQTLKAAYLDIRKAIAEMKALIEEEQEGESEEEEAEEDEEREEEETISTSTQETSTTTEQ